MRCYPRPLSEEFIYGSPESQHPAWYWLCHQRHEWMKEELSSEQEQNDEQDKQ